MRLGTYPENDTCEITIETRHALDLGDLHNVWIVTTANTLVESVIGWYTLHKVSYDFGSALE